MADLNIPVFDGEDYGNWKKRLIIYLKMKKCYNVITRAMTDEDNKDEWDEQNLKVMHYIYNAISNKQLEFVNDKDTAFEIIKKFDDLYSKESTALQIICRNKLDMLRLKDYNDIGEFFNVFEKAVNDLKSAGANVNEKEKLNYILRTLPDSLSYIGDLVDVSKPEDQTAKYVKSKIQMMNIKDKRDNKSAKANAFISEKKFNANGQKVCYSCEKPGHIEKDCRQGEVHRGAWGRGIYGKGRGNNRGYVNHRYENVHRGSHAGQRGYRGGRYNQNQHYQQYEQGGRCESEQQYHQNRDGASSSYVIEVNPKMANNAVKDTSITEINWLLDSGASDHLINDNEYFFKFITLKEPINVKIADVKILKATKVGNVISDFLIYDRTERIDMTNVFYIADLDRNLISVSRITDKHKIVALGNTAKVFSKDRGLITIAWKQDKIYKVTNVIDKWELDVNSCITDNMTGKEKWHRILGHVNFNYLSQICKYQLLEGILENIESQYI